MGRAQGSPRPGKNGQHTISAANPKKKLVYNNQVFCPTDVDYSLKSLGVAWVDQIWPKNTSRKGHVSDSILKGQVEI